MGIVKPDIKRVGIEVGEVVGGEPFQCAYHRGGPSGHACRESVGLFFKTSRYFHVKRLEKKTGPAQKDPGQEKPDVG